MLRKRAITAFLSQKSMIPRLSIAFEDFLGSSIAPQVMPPCPRMYFFVAFAIIAIFTFKIPPKFGLFQILISISNVIFVMAFGFFFNQLQWSSSQSATQLPFLKIIIVNNYINFQSCVALTFIYHDTFCNLCRKNSG